METISSNDHPLLLTPPGFRFYPTEEELLSFYLRHRLAGTTRPAVDRLIPVVDIYGHHPSELRAMAGAANVGDGEQWFFFCPRAARELHGGRPARTTPSGYWKATGSPSFVFSNSGGGGGGGGGGNRVIGEKRTMVFYEGRAPTGSKTRWKMNEYKAVVSAAAADDGDRSATPPPAAMAPAGAPIMLRNEFSVCRVYISTGTLRSFDRRPLNPPPVVGSSHSLAAVHCSYQQQQKLQPLLLPPAGAAAVTVKTTSHQQQQQQQMLDAAVVVDDEARRRAHAAENSHDSSSSVSQGGGGVEDDGAEEDAAAMAIDWDSLISPVDDPAFSGVDDLTRVIWPHI